MEYESYEVGLRESGLLRVDAHCFGFVHDWNQKLE